MAARRDHHGAGAGALGGGERVGDHPARVDRHRHEPQAERAGEVEHARPARVLDGDGVAGGEVGGEHALDRVERPVDRADARRRDAVGGERRGGHLGQLGQHGLLAVEPLRRVELAQRGAEVGQQRRVRAA